jgi:hypothetical protein
VSRSESDIGLGEGAIDTLSMPGRNSGVTSTTSLAAGFGLSCSLLRTVTGAFRKRGRQNDMDAALMPVCCSTWLHSKTFTVLSP